MQRIVEQDLGEQRVVLADLIRHPRIAVKALAEAGGRTQSLTYESIGGARIVGLIEFARWFRAMVAADRDAAVAILSRVFRLGELGLELRPLASVVDAEPVTVEFLQAQAPLGAAAGKLAAAGSEVDAAEAAAILPDVRSATARLTETQVKLEAIVRGGPQLSIPEAR